MKILLTIEKRRSLSTNNSVFISYSILSYHISLYHIVLHLIILYFIVLYCIALHCIILYCILIYHILLYSKSTLLLFSSSCAYLPSKCSSNVSKSLSISISALAQSQIVFTYLQIVQMW